MDWLRGAKEGKEVSAVATMKQKFVPGVPPERPQQQMMYQEKSTWLGKSNWLCYSRSCAVGKHDVNTAPLSPSTLHWQGCPKRTQLLQKSQFSMVKSLSLFTATCIQNSLFWCPQSEREQFCTVYTNAPSSFLLLTRAGGYSLPQTLIS